MSGASNSEEMGGPAVRAGRIVDRARVAGDTAVGRLTPELGERKDLPWSGGYQIRKV